MAEALPEEGFHADANRGRSLDQALRVMRGAREHDIYFEQPSATYDECLAVRRRSDQPMVLYEIVTDAETVPRIIRDDAADMINIKISRVGGLTKARRIRDFCAAGGLAMTIPDSRGGEISQAAIPHLAQSTPERLRRSVFNAPDFSDLVVADGGQPVRDGRLYASTVPGLGITPRMDVLGAPVAVHGPWSMGQRRRGT
jgi:L-alanine-DL-glutamate epimerase-like enolase superfamily enzyme